MTDATCGMRDAADFYIRQVRAKLASGEYAVESVPCVCGSTDSILVTEQDRYGIPYKLHLCTTCGVLYASPRLTADATAQFYAHEYRKIYDQGTTQEHEFRCAHEDGQSLLDLLRAFDVTPTSVIDLGCNRGGMLKAFADIGCRTLGIDADPASIAYGQAQGLSIQHGTFDDLLVTGERADVVILHHVLEHCLDLPKMLDTVRRLLTKDGVVYIGVPGLKTANLDRLWQSAHTYQFSYDTLTYVMEHCGFEALYCDENITSLWKYTGAVRPWSVVDPYAASANASWLFDAKRKIPEIKVFNKFPLSARKANIDTMLARKWPDMAVLEGKETGREAVVIGGGPSVDGQLEALRILKQRGAVIVAIERMYQWCVQHDLTPDYVICLDASEDIRQSLALPVAGVTHLIATQVNPACVEHLAGLPLYIFNTPQGGVPLTEYWDKHGYTDCLVLNAGGSVTLAAMSASLFLGCRSLHIFGFDCHLSDGAYAVGITGVGAVTDSYEVEIGAQVFRTTNAYFSFAQQFFVLMDIAKHLGHLKAVRVYGHSLVSALGQDAIKGYNHD